MAEDTSMAEMLQALTGVMQGLALRQTTPAPKIKLQKFKGPPRAPGEPSLKEWLDDFAVYAKRYRLEGKDKAQALIDHLVGVVKEEVLCRDLSVREDFDQLVDVLNSLFGPAESVQSLSAEFHTRTQREGEGLADYSRVLMRLYSRMEKAASSTDERRALELLRDSSLKENFVRGVRDTGIKRELRRIEMASKGKKFLEMREEVLDLFRDQEPSTKVKVQEALVATPSTTERNEVRELKDDLSSLTRQVSELVEAVKNLQRNSGGQKEYSGGQKEWQGRKLICYNCGEKGHHRNDCSSSRRCFSCKMPGHLKKDCPLNKSTENTRENSQANISLIQGQKEGSVDPLIKRLVSRSPKSVVTIGGLDIGCVLDSGAETSIIPASVYHEQLKVHLGELHSMSGLFLDIVGIGGIDIPIEGYIEVPIHLEGHSLLGSFMIAADRACHNATATTPEYPVLIGCNIFDTIGPSGLIDVLKSAKQKVNEKTAASCSPIPVQTGCVEVLQPFSIRRVRCQIETDVHPSPIGEILVRDTSCPVYAINAIEGCQEPDGE